MKQLLVFALESYGELGEFTGFKNLRVGDAIEINGDEYLVVKYHSFYSVFGKLTIPLNELVDTDFNVVTTFDKINNFNLRDKIGFNIKIKDVGRDNLIPITKHEAVEFMRRNVKIID